METTTATATETKAPRKTGRKTGEKIALKSLCSQLRMDPKAARRKLRKAEFSWHGSRERWLLTEKQAEAARAILKPEAAPKKVKTAAKPDGASKPN